MIENKDWIKKQQMAEEIDENYKLLERVQKNAVEKLDENFELVVNRLFMAMGGFEKIEANIPAVTT